MAAQSPADKVIVARKSRSAVRASAHRAHGPTANGSVPRRTAHATCAELLCGLRADAEDLLVHLCAAQKSEHYFQSKVLLANATSSTARLLLYVREKLAHYSAVRGPAFSREPCRAPRRAHSGDIGRHLSAVGAAADTLAASSPAGYDPDLSNAANRFAKELATYSSGIHELALVASQTYRFDTGLDISRDAIVYAPPSPTRGRVKSIRDNGLRNSLRRAFYIHANAYLEITTLDIVSDLLWKVHTQRPDLMSTVGLDLAWQLVDEARHASLLAARATTLGVPTGAGPVSVQTWLAHRSCTSLEEQIAAQHVIQEGVGLDISLENATKLAAAGDAESGELYTFIACDEWRHVRLGVRALRKLVPEEKMSGFLSKVERRIRREFGFPTATLAVGARESAGCPPAWVQTLER